jgi:D-alanine transaminase
MPSAQKTPIVYLNGQYVSSDEAFISPDDRGFYFADGVYEVIKYYKGHPFCFEEHLARLRLSLAAIRIDFAPLSQLKDICNELLNGNNLKTHYAGIYLQITRGVATRIHRFPDEDIKPTIYLRAFSMPANMNELQNGIRVITREDIRWLRCNIKSIALLPNTLLFQEAAEQRAGECFLVRNGNYTEATHSNILVVMKGKVITHPDSNLILPGITKKAIIRICCELGIDIVERPIRIEETPDIEECFITGTGTEITPVIQIDDRRVGNGEAGPVTRKLQKEFFRITYGELAGEEIILNSEQ